MSLFDKLKQKAEELDLPRKAEELADAATKAAHQAREKAGEVAHQNRDKVGEVLEKASKAIDEKTEGKYHDKVVKAKDSVAKGVDKLAEQRTQGGAGGTATGAAAAGGAGAAWEPRLVEDPGMPNPDADGIVPDPDQPGTGAGPSPVPGASDDFPYADTTKPPAGPATTSKTDLPYADPGTQPDSEVPPGPMP